jgi:arginine repressor
MPLNQWVTGAIAFIHFKHSLRGSRWRLPPLNIFESLVHCIDYNGHLIVVHTKPGTAMTVAKFIDDKKFEQIMGTVAGDDTIIIAPKNVSLIPILADHVKVYLRV